MISASVVSYVLSELQQLSGGLVYALVALLVFGEAALFIGFVLPGETSVIVAGVVASQGHVNIDVLCALVVAAAIVGDSVGYAVGHRYGEHLLRLPIIRKREVALQRALEGLRQRGPVYVFIGRFTAFLRAVMPGLAGMSKMHYRRFLIANALGGIVWGVGYALLGYFAGSALSTIESYASWLGIILLILVFALLTALHFRRRRREAIEEEKWVIEHHEGPDSAEDLQ
ncbi:MAG TPA: DedA family protein [Acidimicrobiales bacterium]|nr:DedA family protein [Acidimicrobiales bacterium]